MCEGERDFRRSPSYQFFTKIRLTTISLITEISTVVHSIADNGLGNTLPIVTCKFKKLAIYGERERERERESCHSGAVDAYHPPKLMLKFPTNIFTSCEFSQVLYNLWHTHPMHFATELACSVFGNHR